MSDDDLYDEGWAGTITTDDILAACFGALAVAASFAFWIYRTFIVPSRPPRRTR